ncbi:MAG: alpha-amylase family glycosyl hydrolase [Ignavibacteriaceae bacterium]
MINTARMKIVLLVLLTFFININGQSVVHPEWSYNQTIYEVNLRQFSESGKFEDFEKHLPRLKEMGVGIIWLMPIHPIGEKNRKGTLGSYYSVKDYLGINPEHGTLEDFKSLVKAIHDQEMYVIIDWVANHTSWDNPLTVENPDFFTKDSLGNFVPPVADWADVIDLNYDNKELWKYMTDALVYWVKECDIDGYRCDVAGMVPLEFWLQAKKELDEIKPLFMLAEDDNPEIHAAFDMTYSWEFHGIMNRIAKGENNAADIIKFLEEEKTKYRPDDFRMRFTSNHDENSWNGTVFERLGDAVEVFAVLSGLVPGMPLVYNGQEAGLNKRLAFFEKDPIEWKEHKFSEVYKTLLNYKLNSKTLQNGKHGSGINFISPAGDEKLLAFVREKEGEKILAVFNLSGQNIDISLNNDIIKGSYRDLFNGEEADLSAELNVSFKPWEYKVFVNK